MLIKNLAESDRKRAIIIASQHLEEAEMLASRVCILKNGKVIVDESPENIKASMGI